MGGAVLCVLWCVGGNEFHLFDVTTKMLVMMMTRLWYGKQWMGEHNNEEGVHESSACFNI